MASARLAGALVLTCTEDGRHFTGDVVIEDDRLVEVGPSGTTPADRTIDLEGHTIVPGLIDLHMHLTFRRVIGPIWDVVRDADAFNVIRSVQNAMTVLRQGVTTVRELGAPNDLNLAIRTAVRDGMIPGPRVLAVGKPLSASGSHVSPIARTADGAAGFRAITRQTISRGAEWIKLVSSNDPIDEPRDGQYSHPELDADEIGAVVDTAHAWGAKVAVHAMGSENIRTVAAAGADTIEHGMYLDEEAAAVMKSNGVALVPTLSGYLENSLDRWERGAAWAERHEKLVAPQRESFRVALDTGVRIAFGTDSLGELVRELELMVEYGMDQQAALRAATLTSAQVLGYGDRLGSIEVGKLADLCIVEGNVLEDLTALRNVRYVVQQGRIMEPSSIQLPSGDQMGESEPSMPPAPPFSRRHR